MFLKFKTEEMLVWTLLFLFTNVLFNVEAVDKCGDKCISTQICANNGTCIDLSELIKCGWWDQYYCLKGQDCCGFDGCIPAGSVCCNNYITYCKSGETCCSLFCCRAGFVCQNGDCVLDTFSTQKPSTTITSSTHSTAETKTRYPATETKTRYPSTEPKTHYFTKSSTTYTSPRTTKWYDGSVTSSHYESSTSIMFRWWYGVIIGAVVFIVAVIIALVIRRHRNMGSNAPGQPKSSGMVLNAPTYQANGQPANIYSVQSNGAPVLTQWQPQPQNIPVRGPNTNGQMPKYITPQSIPTGGPNTNGQMPPKYITPQSVPTGGPNTDGQMPPKYMKPQNIPVGGPNNNGQMPKYITPHSIPTGGPNTNGQMPQKYITPQNIPVGGPNNNGQMPKNMSPQSKGAPIVVTYTNAPVRTNSRQSSGGGVYVVTKKC